MIKQQALKFTIHLLAEGQTLLTMIYSGLINAFHCEHALVKNPYILTRNPIIMGLYSTW